MIQSFATKRSNGFSKQARRKGEYAISGTGEYRLTFRFENGEARGEFGGLPLMKDFLNGRKRRPTHPGEALREDIMPNAGVNQAQLAKALGVSRLTVSEIVLEKRPVTPDIAIRLAKYFGSSPDLWLGLQKDVDLWDAMSANRKVYNRIRPLKRSAA